MIPKLLGSGFLRRGGSHSGRLQSDAAAPQDRAEMATAPQHGRVGSSSTPAGDFQASGRRGHVYLIYKPGL